MEPHPLATDIAIGFAKIDLGMARSVCQGHEHFLLASGGLVNIVAHDRIAAGKAMLIAQSLPNADGGVPLLGMHVFVGFPDGINDAGEGGKLGGDGFALAPVAGRHSVLAHLLDGFAVNPKKTRHFAFALAFHHHRASNLYV